MSGEDEERNTPLILIRENSETLSEKYCAKKTVLRIDAGKEELSKATFNNGKRNTSHLPINDRK